MIDTKQKNKGKITILKELLRYLFHCSDAEIISFKERSIINPITGAILFVVRPLFEIIDVLLKGITLVSIIEINIRIPLYDSNILPIVIIA